ncbi:MAG: AAA family ATPase [Deltaproteobacteria bacterium]|nr:AAA family ATPase [Deltaproteobacteria bacterium]MBW2071687.1 AAA family ATPase [Deltaproteobacteria bacterium]
MAKKYREVPVAELAARIDPKELGFETTDSLCPPEEGVVAQDRAIQAIKFGMGMKDIDYNVFVAGEPKTGLTYLARTFLEKTAKDEPTPPDWCYVYNFKEPDSPKALSLSAGRGKELKKSMEQFVHTLQAKIPEVFDSDDYRAKEAEVHQAFEKKRRELIDELAAKAKEEGFILQFSQVGMVIVPAREDGQPMSQEDLSQLPDEEKKSLREKSDQLQKEMSEAIKEIRKAEAAFREKHSKLDAEIAMYVVGHLMETLEEQFKEEKDVLEYLKEVQEDILENIDDFKKKPEQQQQQPAPFPQPPKEVTMRKYDVNVLIDNSETRGAPVIIESNPSYPNLFGSIERQAYFGALFTDFTMIKPGALHKANGGYLVMKALDLLKYWISWEALKRAVKDGEIKIEDLGELYGIFSTRTLKPTPIPLKVKLVLTGDAYLYQLLYTYDDRFPKMFKVKAHLDTEVDHTADMLKQCACVMSKFCGEQKLRHVTSDGVARVLEHSMELTGDREKLTLKLGDVSDLLKEANYYAGLDGAEFINRSHVQTAIDNKIYRANLYEEKVQELVKKDIFWVETDGYKVGQVNGLSILQTGDHVFGKPSRITATIALGKEGIVDIDREAKLSGNIHTKGVMILTSFLREKFAQDKPLSLSASLCFEQSYGMIDGDSASSTELYVLLSAISGVPIFQGIAVTGSVSQKGEIQPIGGVTRKIEGFFEICKHKGLTGAQGVLIPEKNVKNLMLKQEVVEAVEKGQFHIYPISTIEEGIEILTGVEAGVRQEDGTYPEGTVFRKVDDKLREMAEMAKEFGKGREEEEKKKNEEN